MSEMINIIKNKMRDMKFTFFTENYDNDNIGFFVGPVKIMRVKRLEREEESDIFRVTFLYPRNINVNNMIQNTVDFSMNKLEDQGKDLERNVEDFVNQMREFGVEDYDDLKGYQSKKGVIDN